MPAALSPLPQNPTLALHRLAQVMQPGLALPLVLQRLLDFVAPALAAERGLLLWRTGADPWQPAASFACDPADAAQLAGRLPASIGQIALQSGAAQLGVVSTTPGSGLASVLCAPIAAPVQGGAPGQDAPIAGLLYLERSLQQQAFTPADLALLAALVASATGAIQHTAYAETLRHAQHAFERAFEATLEGWALTLELRDHETEGHTRRVTEVSVAIGQRLNIASEALTHLRRGALLHDIGKLGIPDSVLLKAGPLTAEEWELMKRHTVLAQQILGPIDLLQPACDIPYCHHEKWDGSGYPRGLAGERIPLAARIFAVVDVWDALCANRPYRKAWPEEKALAYLQEHAGSQFDPAVVENFLHYRRTVYRFTL